MDEGADLGAAEQGAHSSEEISFQHSFQSAKGGLITSLSTPTERRSETHNTSPPTTGPLRTSLSLTDDDVDVDDDDDPVGLEGSLYSSDRLGTAEDSATLDGMCNSANLCAEQPSRFTRPPGVPPLRQRKDSPNADERFSNKPRMPSSTTPLVKSSKTVTTVDLRASTRRDSESLSSGPLTPSTERLKASRKDEVINFLRQVISSERALRSKVAELKDERESVQVNNFRFEHILRRCVGEQAMELETVKRTIEEEQQKYNEERYQRKQEEWRRRKAERSLARYRQKLLSLRQIALSAQDYLAQAESLLAEQTVRDEISHSPEINTLRAVAANHIQHRRDLWKLRQQQSSHRELFFGKTSQYMTTEELLSLSPHESIAQKALQDIEMILDIIRRTFKIEAEMLEGQTVIPTRPTASRSTLGAEAPSPKFMTDYSHAGGGPSSSSTARVYRLLKKIEKEIASRSQGFQLPNNDQPSEDQRVNIPHTRVSLVQPPFGSPLCSPAVPVYRTSLPPPSLSPPQPPGKAFHHKVPSAPPPAVPLPMFASRSGMGTGRPTTSATPWFPRLPDSSSSLFQAAPVVYRHVNVLASPSVTNSILHRPPVLHQTSEGPTVFKQPPRLSNVRFGLRRQMAS
eukprot:Gregarina_sp_Poly_1__9118@NODE_55_length_17436_cov_154_331798_g47_i0_p2_GENE_NODE_55_length_17436_cov_154_331798_g47_i0NODE_55_length_17436_cov_154_331798_g47_i0_p2_ORF_typecomplete_len629_score99_55Phage_HK97_TLTM/PF06120_11/1_6Retrotrans_gag/PF03732_17/2_3e02Retrotrans_gag/PF03732_17/31_NODE_55_length_17436_cov_154_331798_g47_i066908576